MSDWTDNHCHLGLAGEATELVAEARDGGVRRLVDVGTDVESSLAAIANGRAHAEVWATAGVHPHEASGGIEGLEEVLAADEVVAVGECGLDYHYDHSPRPVQQEVFAAQIELAHRHELPLVIHTREAWDDTFAVLGACGVPDRAVFHCFTGGPAEARKALDLGAYLSFSGVVTFKNADDVRAAAVLCPDDHVLIETDSPYLAPVPYRGRQNRPIHVRIVGAAVADVRGVPAATVAELTWQNAQRVYQFGAMAAR